MFGAAVVAAVAVDAIGHPPSRVLDDPSKTKAVEWASDGGPAGGVVNACKGENITLTLILNLKMI